jgi:hypothetical protein
LCTDAYVVGANTGTKIPTPAPPPSPAATRDGRWVQDIQYLASELPRLHKDGLQHISLESFKRQAGALADRVHDLSDVQISREVMHLTTLLRDGETGVNPRGEGRFGFNVKRLDGALRLTALPKSYKAAIGGELIAMNGIPLDEVIKAIAYVDSAVTDWELANKLRIDLPWAPLLAVAGITSDPARVTLTVRSLDARVRTIPLRLGEPASLSDYATTPRTLASERVEPYWLHRDPTQRLVYLRYFQCVNDTGFQQLAKEAIDSLLRDGTQRLIVDLRGNTGGNSRPFEALLGLLNDHKDLARTNRVAGLIDSNVFSSGTLAAARLHELAHVLLVGEPTADPVNQYGNWRTFNLPNSGLVVRYSTSYFDPFPAYHGKPYVSPDVQVHPSVADVLAGRDPVLSSALARLRD